MGRSWGLGESWGREQARRGQRQHLEQGAHFARVEQAPAGLFDVADFRRARPGFEALGPGFDAQAQQELPLGKRPIGRGTRLLGGLGQGREIDMGREVRLADIGQRVDMKVPVSSGAMPYWGLSNNGVQVVEVRNSTTETWAKNFADSEMTT